MEIAKLHCLGNVYFVVRAANPHHPLPALAGALGRELVMDGVKGLIVLCQGPPGRRRIELYNPHGVRVVPGTCALRCAGYTLGPGSWELETVYGARRVEVKGRETTAWFQHPVYGGEYQIGRDYHGYLLNLVHRYFITFRKNSSESNIQAQGDALNRYFGGASIIFLRDEEGWEARIWQRGGELSGSSTGACAAAAVLRRLGGWQESVVITMPGGKVTVFADQHGRFVQQAEVELLSTVQLNFT